MYSTWTDAKSGSQGVADSGEEERKTKQGKAKRDAGHTVEDYQVRGALDIVVLDKSPQSCTERRMRGWTSHDKHMCAAYTLR